MSANYTPEAPSFKELSYMHMKALQNFPYIEADFDALTNYELLSKIVEYLNNVISNNNEQNEVVTNLYNAFVSLQNYINDYFDNLDVQEEINNKLDDMTASGELTEIIKSYVDPIYQSYENEINETIDTQNQRINSINTLVNSVASGSPLVASDVSGMSDTTRVYVNTTDGKWYYYDGDSWEIGGTYQSTGIGDNEVEYENLSINLQNLFSTDLSNVTTTSEHYIRYDGRYSDSNSFSVTDPILVKKGETIYCKTAGTTTQAIFSEKVSNKYYPLVLGTEEPGSDTVNEYFYTAQKDIYIVITFRHNRDYAYYKLVSSNELVKLENIKEYTPPFTIDEGHYINASGNYASSSPYYLSSPILLKSGDKITLTGIAEDTVSVIAQKNGDGTYASLVVGLSQTEVKTYEYTNNNLYDINIVLSYLNTYPTNIIKIITQNIFTDIYENLNEEMNNNQKSNYLMAFDNITAIGDSLTYSQVYTGANTHRQSYNPYPKVLGRLLGCTYDILAVSGDTPITWWARYENDLTNTDKDNLFIVYLGTNGGLTDTLATDAPENLDPSLWSNTNTGCYAKIVNKCSTLGGKIILIQPWVVSAGASLSTTQSVINQIATRFNCVSIAPIKLENPNYHYYPDKTGSNTVHLNDLGYAVFAQQVVDEVSTLSDNDVNKLILN